MSSAVVDLKGPNMKNYFVALIIVSALTVSVVIIRQKSEAQNTSPQLIENKESSPIFVANIPPGYRDWRLISVAHEEGNLNDIRAILGNDIAIKAYREGKFPFPDGTIVVMVK
jgi:hypothetical protein